MLVARLVIALLASGCAAAPDDLATSSVPGTAASPERTLEGIMRPLPSAVRASDLGGLARAFTSIEGRGLPTLADWVAIAKDGARPPCPATSKVCGAPARAVIATTGGATAS